MYRVSLYSADMNSSPTPNKVYVVGCLFCLLNGYMQGRYLTNFASYDTSWFYDPRFVVGCLVFLFGMAINIQADMLLKSLRKPGETGYKIPRGKAMYSNMLCRAKCIYTSELAQRLTC